MNSIQFRRIENGFIVETEDTIMNHTWRTYFKTIEEVIAFAKKELDEELKRWTK